MKNEPPAGRGARIAFLESVIANIADIVTILDADGTIRYANPSALRILGETKIGTQVMSHVHPDDAPGVRDALARAMNEPAWPARVEFRFRHANGSWLVLEATATNLLGDPAVGGLMVTSRDMTDRRAAEDRLRSLTQAIQQSPVAVIIADPTGAIQYVNPQFTVITGYNAEEVYGKNPRMLKSGQTSDEQYRQLWATLSRGEIWRGELCNRRKDGKLYWALASISPIRAADGMVEHFVAVQEDITERRALEQQLRQAQKMEAVGQLAGGVAHDFNNLLTAMLLYTELLRDDVPQDDPRRQDFDTVLGAGQRAQAMTRQLLAFSRQQVVQPAILDVNTIVQGSERLLRRLIGEDIALETQASATVGNVRADAGQLEQVLMNLVVNARDAMPNGGRLTIGTSMVDLHENDRVLHDVPRAGQYAVIDVTDTGSGMTPDVRARIFEPFFTTKPVGKGTGLGLATAFGIVKQAGGCITVYSEVGQGTRFRVYLPLVGGKATVAPGPTRNIADLRGSETILVVDDEVGLRTAVAGVLERHGYNVIVAASGEEALARLATLSGPLHLVLADVVMTGMSGPAMVSQLRGARTGLKALFMSGYADASTRRGVEESGLPVISKPFTIAELASRVRHVLDA